MSEISVERDFMEELLKKPEAFADDLRTELGTPPAAFDGGIASERIAVILRISMESAQLAADLSTTVCTIAREALADQMATEEDVLESLTDFTETAFE